VLFCIAIELLSDETFKFPDNDSEWPILKTGIFSWINSAGSAMPLKLPSSSITW
jgi:hypothetical protein